MATLAFEFSPEVTERLRQEAAAVGDTIQGIAEKLLRKQLNIPPAAPEDEREKVLAVLRAAGLLTELSQEEKQRARRSTATLEEVQAILDRAGGKPLSEVIIEMRGPKD